MSSWGNAVKISIFGESHGKGIGVVIDGLPSGEKIDFDEICIQMGRRAPGKDKASTPRLEKDIPEIMSGMLNDTTTGAPLCAIIKNSDTRSQDYGNLLTNPRPGHAAYTGHIRYGGFNDIRGGGHFSGRLTAPLVFAGAVCRQILERRNIKIAAHISSVGKVKDKCFDGVNISDELISRLSKTTFGLIDQNIETEMREVIEECRMNRDSIGGTVECAIVGFPAGVGSPMFYGIENVISSIVFAVPAVKGIEFGAGFGASELRGSQNNDEFYYDGDTVKTRTNNHGGILGGISSGMPIIFRTAIKPTPSISQSQKTVNLAEHTDSTLEIHGRHDPCIVVRAVPVIESAAAVAAVNLLAEVQKL